MRYTWEIVIRLRPVIFAALLASLIVSLPTQILELYLIDIETVSAELHKFKEVTPGEPLPTSPLQFLSRTYTIWFAMSSGLFTMVVLWLASAHLVCLAPDWEHWPRGRRRLAAGLVVLIALAPVLGVLVGLNNLRIRLPQIVPSQEGVLNDAETLLEQVRTYILISAALAQLGAILFSFLTFARLDFVAAICRRIFSGVGVAIGIGIILAFTAAMVVWPTAAPWAIGAQALNYLFLASLIFVLTWLSQIYRRTGWPVAVLVFAAALFFSLMGWNDNHRVDYKVVASENGSIEKNFEAWLLSRADRKWYTERGKPYPVYVVATEGGGIYAGYHAASWLGRMQDHCRIFAQHTFAISSVSGGSLGAGVFAGLAHKLASNGEHRDCGSRLITYTKAADAFFENDLLAPLVGGALFPDFLQRLLPVPIKALDRARAFEEAFAIAWDRSADWLGTASQASKGVFRQTVRSLWDPTGAAPALFLNTTSVAAGSRVTISPMWFQQTSTALHINSTLCFGGREQPGPQGAVSFLPPSKSVEIGLATAISLSARFPWLTPAGWLDLAQSDCPDKKENDRVYLVDGGYFENSGLETAIELATYMRAAISSKAYAQSRGVDLDKIQAEHPYGVDIRIIMIFAIDYTASRYIQSSAERAGTRPGEALPPIEAMLAGRNARTRAVHLHAVEEGDLPFAPGAGGVSGRYVIDPKGDVRFGQDAVHQVWIDGKRFFLPLGWRLSQRSMGTISSIAGASLAANLVQAELEGRDTDELKGRKRKSQQ